MTPRQPSPKELHRGRRGIKRSQPKRDWTDARDKVSREGCRVCGNPAEAAHVIGREHDRHMPLVWDGESRWDAYYVDPRRIVPLCPSHHRTGLQAYDDGTLDLSPYLRLDEALQAVADAGSIHLALKRIMGRDYDAGPNERSHE